MYLSNGITLAFPQHTVLFRRKQQIIYSPPLSHSRYARCNANNGLRGFITSNHCASRHWCSNLLWVVGTLDPNPVPVVGQTHHPSPTLTSILNNPSKAGGQGPDRRVRCSESVPWRQHRPCLAPGRGTELYPRVRPIRCSNEGHILTCTMGNLPPNICCHPVWRPRAP